MPLKPFQDTKNSPVLTASKLIRPIVKAIPAKQVSGARYRKPVKEKL